MEYRLQLRLFGFVRTRFRDYCFCCGPGHGARERAVFVSTFFEGRIAEQLRVRRQYIREFHKERAAAAAVGADSRYLCICYWLEGKSSSYARVGIYFALWRVFACFVSNICAHAGAQTQRRLTARMNGCLLSPACVAVRRDDALSFYVTYRVYFFLRVYSRCEDELPWPDEAAESRDFQFGALQSRR